MVTLFMVLNILVALYHVGMILLGILMMLGSLPDLNQELVQLQDSAEQSGYVFGYMGPQVMALVLNLAIALMASLSAVGLAKRTTWGYYCHIVAAIMAISPCGTCCLGIIYTIPALICAFLPDFRQEFPGLQKE